VAASVGHGLHDVAEDRTADLIVAGGCHRSAIGRVLIGDDARSVVQHAPCAVAIAPGDARAAIGQLMGQQYGVTAAVTAIDADDHIDEHRGVLG
jgi:Universal stress protein family